MAVTRPLVHVTPRQLQHVSTGVVTQPFYRVHDGPFVEVQVACKALQSALRDIYFDENVHLGNITIIFSVLGHV